MTKIIPTQKMVLDKDICERCLVGGEHPKAARSNKTQWGGFTKDWLRQVEVKYWIKGESVCPFERSFVVTEVPVNCPFAAEQIVS